MLLSRADDSISTRQPKQTQLHTGNRALPMEVATYPADLREEDLRGLHPYWVRHNPQQPQRLRLVCNRALPMEVATYPTDLREEDLRGLHPYWVRHNPQQLQRLRLVCNRALPMEAATYPTDLREEDLRGLHPYWVRHNPQQLQRPRLHPFNHNRATLLPAHMEVVSYHSVDSK